MISEYFTTIFVIIFFLSSLSFQLINFVLKLFNFCIVFGIVRFQFKLLRHLWNLSIVSNFILIIIKTVLIFVSVIPVLISWFTIWWIVVVWVIVVIGIVIVIVWSVVILISVVVVGWFSLWLLGKLLWGVWWFLLVSDFWHLFV